MSLSKEQQLYNAAFYGELEKVKSLCSDPNLNINWQYEGGTPFLIACEKGHKEVVSLLLADPRVDPNKAQNEGATPFFIACEKGHKEVVSLLLADPRVDPNKPKNDSGTSFFIACQNGHKELVSLLLADPRIGHTKPLNNLISPLWIASQNGHLVIVQHLLASGIEVDTKMRSTFNHKTAFEHGKAMGIRKKDHDIAPVGKTETEDEFKLSKTNGPLCADLIDAYEKDPAKVRSQLRKQLGPRGISFPSPLSPCSCLSTKGTPLADNR